MDPTNELNYLRVGSKKQEILIAPGQCLWCKNIFWGKISKNFLDEDFILIVIQNQVDSISSWKKNSIMFLIWDMWK